MPAGAGVAAAAGVADSLAPWMLTDGGQLADAAARLTPIAEAVAEQDAIVTGSVVDASTALGWRGMVVDRASTAGVATTSLLSRVIDDLHEARRAMIDLADLLAAHGPELRQIRQDSAALEPPESPLTMEEHAQRRDNETGARLAARMSGLRVDLVEADRRCSATLDAITAALDNAVRPGLDGTFLRSIVPSGAWGIFAARGILDSPADAEIAAAAYRTETVTALREELDRIPPARLEAFLRRHPALADRLAGDRMPLWPKDQDLAGLMRATGGLSSQGQVRDPAAIAEITSYWRGLTPDQRARLRAYYPALIGNLDGIPVPHRAAANQWLIRSAGRSLEVQLAFLQANPEADPNDLQDVLGRRDLYQSMISPIAFGPGRSGPILDGEHLVLDSMTPAVLAFDPSGDGTYAQWHGSFNARYVAVYTPGTGSDLGSIAETDELVRQFTLEPGTAGITWMGVDLPDTVPDAAWRRYSSDGGAALLRFVEGLGLRPDQQLTAAGHSAGGGIVAWADVLGARFDRTMLLAPSGAATGIPFTTPDRYPADAWDGTPRQTRRYTQTVPGDAIVLAQRSEDIRAGLGLAGLLTLNLGHGDDPNDHPQIVRLETGRSCSTDEEQPCSGERLGSDRPHSEVKLPGTDAYQNIVGVITDGTAIPYRTEDNELRLLDFLPLEFPIVGPTLPLPGVNVYSDDDYRGTDPIPIRFLAPDDGLRLEYTWYMLEESLRP